MLRLCWRLAWVATLLVVNFSGGLARAVVSAAASRTPSAASSDPGAAGIPGTAAFASAPGLEPNAPLKVVRARRGGPIARTGPSQTSAPLSGLYYDTYLNVVGEVTDASGVVW